MDEFSQGEIRFGRYRLDPIQGLKLGRRDLHLTPKSLAVLRLLAEHPSQVVSKEEIFRMLWADTAVSDSALTSCIQELRHVLRDDARNPHYIETVHRRGYRFIAEALTTAELPVTSKEPSYHIAEPLIVGREAVLAAMFRELSATLEGDRRILFISGEPGIGKTTLVNAFLARATQRHRVCVGMGNCVEQYGIGEPHLPLLDALARMGRHSRSLVVAALSQYAPTWLIQLPGLQSPAQVRSLLRRSVGVTRERVLRELTDAIDAMAAKVPIVISLEDLHWADYSTIDWIAAAGRYPERSQILLLGTYRRTELPASHPLLAVTDELRVKGLCREIVLDGLDESAVYEYLGRRYPPAEGSVSSFRSLACAVHRQTEGSPLFVVNVLSDLVTRGALVESDGTWTASRDDAAVTGIPEDVRRIIERQLDRLLADERCLLEAASVLGKEWSAASVAAATDMPLSTVDTVLGTLARQGRFVRVCGTMEWPDGTVASRVTFLHSLYRRVIYDRIPASRRADLHRLVAIRQEAAYGERAADLAAELAVHFEQARDFGRAVSYLRHAGHRDRRHSAYSEAKMHFGRALALLIHLPASSDRDELEAVLSIELGAVLMALQGWGSPEVEMVYDRARKLCRKLGETPQLFPALWGLWLFYWGRGDLTTARELADKLGALGRETQNQEMVLQGDHALWATSFSLGELDSAIRYAEDGIALYDPFRHADLAGTYGNHDAAVCARCFSARALALQGLVDRAVRIGDDAIALAEQLAHPFTQALALVFSAAVHQMRRDVDMTKERAMAAAKIAREQDFRLMLAWASVLGGWAIVEQGNTETGTELIRFGLTAARQTGSQQFQPYAMVLLAEAYLKCGTVDAGIRILDEAASLVDRTGERFFEAELHRLRGEFASLSGTPDGRRTANSAFSKAIDVAKKQGAKLLVLRAAVSMARLHRDEGKSLACHRMLSAAYVDIKEGLTLRDAIDAATLLTRWNTGIDFGAQSDVGFYPP